MIAMDADGAYIDKTCDKHRLLLASSALLLRTPIERTAVGDMPDTKARTISTTEVLRGRLVLAEANNWQTLVDQLVKECNEDKTGLGE